MLNKSCDVTETETVCIIYILAFYPYMAKLV